MSHFGKRKPPGRRLAAAADNESAAIDNLLTALVKQGQAMQTTLESVINELRAMEKVLQVIVENMENAETGPRAVS